MGVTTSSTLKKTFCVWADEKPIEKARGSKESDRSFPRLCDFNYKVLALAPHSLWLANNLSPPCSQQFLYSLDGTQGILLRVPPLSTWQQMICSLAYKKLLCHFFLPNAEEKGKASVSLLTFIFCLFFPFPSSCSLFFLKKSVQNNGMHLIETQLTVRCDRNMFC